MEPESVTGSQWTRVWIPLGVVLFIFALALSAFVVPELRPLRTFQALIYVAVVILARRNHAAGFGAGITIAVIWNSLQLFITHLMQTGGRLLWTFMSTGKLSRIDTIAVFIGGIGHFILIVACVVAFVQLRPGRRDWRRFGTGAVVTLAYFAAIVATMRPR
jgi:hypothetical protein